MEYARRCGERMRVKLERGQTTAKVKTGLFSSVFVTTHDIRITIDFTEEDRATLAQSGLTEYAFYQKPPDPIMVAARTSTPEQWEQFGLGQISVGSLLEDNSRIIHYKNLLEANRGEMELEAAVQTLKEAILVGKPPKQSSRVIK